MKPAERSNARLAVVQALYQMEVAGKGLHEVQAEFEAHWLGREIEGARYLPAEVGFFREVLAGVLGEQRVIDTKIDAALSGGWPLARIETVMRAILRAGAYELMNRPDVPASVAIKEYVDVAGRLFRSDRMRHDQRRARQARARDAGGGAGEGRELSAPPEGEP